MKLASALQGEKTKFFTLQFSTHQVNIEKDKKQEQWLYGTKNKPSASFGLGEKQLIKWNKI